MAQTQSVVIAFAKACLAMYAMNNFGVLRKFDFLNRILSPESANFQSANLLLMERCKTKASKIALAFSIKL